MGIKRMSRRRRDAATPAPEIPEPPPPPSAAASAAGRPDWLPEGWKIEIRRRNNSERVDRYYICPESGKMFRSKPEVFRYLAPSSGNVENSDGHASRTPFVGGYSLGLSGGKIENSGGHCRQHLLAALEDYPLEWLPAGWILEFGAWMNGGSAADNYKCYFDPVNGSRFYSKEEVLCYLQARKLSNPRLSQGGSANFDPAIFFSSSQKENINVNRPRNVFAQIDFSPSGLPHGWIKEIRFTETNSSRRSIRRDAYYIDTVSGYAFRSSKDALRYLENNEMCRYAFRLEKSHLPKAHSLKKESLQPAAAKRPKVKKTAVRNHLFPSQMRKCNEGMVADLSDSLFSPSLPHADCTSSELNSKEDLADDQDLSS